MTEICRPEPACCACSYVKSCPKVQHDRLIRLSCTCVAPLLIVLEHICVPWPRAIDTASSRSNNAVAVDDANAAKWAGPAWPQTGFAGDVSASYRLWILKGFQADGAQLLILFGTLRATAFIFRQGSGHVA